MPKLELVINPPDRAYIKYAGRPGWIADFLVTPIHENGIKLAEFIVVSANTAAGY